MLERVYLYSNHISFLTDTPQALAKKYAKSYVVFFMQGSFKFYEILTILQTV